jgi:serine/threonine protein kinase
MLPASLVMVDRERRLGSGTYAIVYEGTYLGNDVAVKRFDNQDAASLKAFKTELQILNWLRDHGSHPNLVHIYGAFTDPTSSYIVLEQAP